MNAVNLNIEGFKCYRKASFQFGNITLLTGANSSGKSSVLQALLILYLIAQDSNRPLAKVLNDPDYSLELGEVFDILFQYREEKADKAVLTLDDFSVILRDAAMAAEIPSPADPSSLNQMNFLCAERLGPRSEVKIIGTTDNYCGCNGNYTAEVMDNNVMTNIDPNRTLDGTEVKLPVALDEWTNLIFPGINIRVRHKGDSYLQTIVSSTGSSIQSKTPNVGFGISYALPIIVSGLLAKVEDWLVIENPEAHLHAKAQSNMGYFLAQMASTGVRVVVETHSEHIVNGIRRFIVCTKRLQPSEAPIYYLPADFGTPQKITIDSQGNLSDFPVDFFDQSRQDLLEIIKASRS